MKMAIYGAGSLGTITGALLAKAGYDIDLIDINAEHVKALNEKGAKIIGQMELVQPVKALVPDDMNDQYDIMIYLTKATQNESALKYVAKYLKPDGVVLVGQNGLPEGAVAEVVGKERVVGCVIAWGATWVEPGVSRLTSPPEQMNFSIGEVDGNLTERLKNLEEILKKTGPVRVVTDLLGRRWGKLTTNCCFSSMSAIVNGTYGDVLDNPKALRCSAHINNESMAIANAAGIIPVTGKPGHDYLKLTFKTEQELEEKLPGVKALEEKHRGIKTGILFDIAAGRYPEIDTTYNGVLCRWGAKYGIPTPVNEQVVNIIHEMAEGKLNPDSANVDLIKLPDLPEK